MKCIITLKYINIYNIYPYVIVNSFIYTFIYPLLFYVIYFYLYLRIYQIKDLIVKIDEEKEYHHLVMILYFPKGIDEYDEHGLHLEEIFYNIICSFLTCEDTMHDKQDQGYLPKEEHHLKKAIFFKL